MVQIGDYARATFGIASAVLIFSGFNDVGLQSAGASSWETETSLIVINIRSRGVMKIGLGIGLIGSALLGVSTIDKNRNRSEIRATETNTTDGKEETANEPNPRRTEASSDPSENFIASTKLYKSEGGTGEPDPAKSTILFATIYLRDSSGKELAFLTKSPSTNTSLGQWEIVSRDT